MVNLRQELDVNTESAVKLGTGFGNESLGELFLEHEDCATEHRLVGQEFKC
jgi:hypothetical protein